MSTGLELLQAAHTKLLEEGWKPAADMPRPTSVNNSPHWATVIYQRGGHFHSSSAKIGAIRVFVGDGAVSSCVEPLYWKPWEPRSK